MTTAAHKWDKLRADDWAGLKDRQSEQALVHPKFEGGWGICLPPRRRRGCFLSSVSTDIVTHCPGNQKKKIERHPQTRSTKTRGLQGDWEEGVRWLRERKCRPGRDDKCSMPGSRAWGTRFPSTHTPVHTPTHPLDMLFFSTFFSRAPNPRHMTFC